ncbi:MAG TPA: hypothetical protein ACFCUD_09200 [Cyclobacteriaceae bacterium]
MLRLIFRALFAILSLLGLIFTFYGLNEVFFVRENELWIDITLLMLMGILPLYYGVKMYRKYSVPAYSLENQTLRLATQNEGRLTVPEVAMKLNISIEKARSLLEKMQLNNVFSIEITDQGAIVYRMNNYASDTDKGSAKGII